LNINTKATRNGLAVRIFPAAMQTFTKDMALSEHSKGTALYVGISLYTSVYFNLHVPRKRMGRQNTGCSYESSISFIIAWACAFRTIISDQRPVLTSSHYAATHLTADMILSLKKSLSTADILGDVFHSLVHWIMYVQLPACNAPPLPHLT
jgi:hypothetical protein